MSRRDKIEGRLRDLMAAAGVEVRPEDEEPLRELVDDWIVFDDARRAENARLRREMGL